MLLQEVSGQGAPAPRNEGLERHGDGAAAPHPEKEAVMPKKWHRCVEKVKAKGTARNPYAVCTRSTGLTRSGKRSMKRRTHRPT